MKKYCSVCQQTKEIVLFRKCKLSKDGYDYICKACYRERAREYRKAIPILERRRRDKNEYLRKRSLLPTLSLAQAENRWLAYQCKAKKYQITKEILRTLLHQGLSLFPYMTLINILGDGNSLRYASIDRIDNQKGYSNDNIRVIPLWLNMAKRDGTQAELDVFIKDYYQRFLS